MRTITKYEASDGTEFDNKPQAKAYERLLKARARLSNLINQMVDISEDEVISDEPHQSISKDWLLDEHKMIGEVFSEYTQADKHYSTLFTTAPIEVPPSPEKSKSKKIPKK